MREKRSGKISGIHPCLDAIAEGIEIEFLAAPLAILRAGEKVEALKMRRMKLGEPDDSGRRRPQPLEAEIYELRVDNVITAVSRQPDWTALDAIAPKDGWLAIDESGHAKDNIWGGGDSVSLGTASEAISQGRIAAETLYASLNGLPKPEQEMRLPVSADNMHFDYYPVSEPVRKESLPPEQRLNTISRELDRTMSEEQFLQEAQRCLSCGLCFGCGHCWMYCNPSVYIPKQPTSPGDYFDQILDACDGCGKCIDICPSGYLSRRL